MNELKPGRAFKAIPYLPPLFGITLILLLSHYSGHAATLWDEEVVESTAGTAYYNDIAIASDGTAHIAYQNDSSQDMRLASRDTSGTWSLQTVESDHDSGSFASIALESDGTPHLAWYQNYSIGSPPFTMDLWKLRHAVWNGSGWTYSDVIGGQDTGEFADLTLDASGDAVVAHYDYGTTHEAHVRRWDGSSPWPDELLESSSDYPGVGISVATDASGNTHVAYVKENTGILIYQFHNGTSWSSDIVDNSGVEGGKTDIAVYGSTVHIIYKDSDGLRYATDSPGSWTTEEIDDGSGDGVWYESPCLDLDSNGVPHVSYIGNFSLRYAHRKSGSWVVSDVDYDNPDRFTSIAVDTNNIPHISFRTNDGGTESLVHIWGGYADDDDDGMADDWELANGLDPTDPDDATEDPDGDPDGDGLYNLSEYQNGTDPQNPDTDGDGLWDHEELGAGTDPNNPDTDDDNLPDGWEVDNSLDPNSATGANGAAGNPDEDAFTNIKEYEYGLNPQDGSDGVAGDDPDYDNLTNTEEAAAGTHPLQQDTDGDGLMDGGSAGNPGEAQYSTDPLDDDSDDDGLLDGVEAGYHVFWDSFEDSSINEDWWTLTGDADWQIDSSSSQEGSQSLRSGAIGNNQSCSIERTATFLGQGSLSFYFRTSSETGADTLTLSIDGDVQATRSGEESWDEVYIPSFIAGTHTFRWTYQKNASGSSGSDQVWIDSIYMGVPGTGSSPTNEDSDDDGLNDYDEVINHGTHPGRTDSDFDGLDDWAEINTHLTDPTDWDTDDDGLGDGYEVNDLGTEPDDDDTDDDGMPDGWEDSRSLDPLIATGGDGPDGDPDSDNLTNLEEYQLTTHPNSDDTDGDLMTDGWEVTYSLDPKDNDSTEDPDNDTLTNVQEFNLGTNPQSNDSDGDTMTDGWEATYSLDPTTDDSTGDADSDTLSNLQEFNLGTSPRNSDSDSDNMPDAWEVAHALDPTFNNASADADSDGLENGGEYQRNTDPQNPDSDGDGLNDGQEVFDYATNPNDPDSDGDTMPDKWEVDNNLAPTTDDTTGDPDSDNLDNLGEFNAGTDPQNPDSDGDTMTDGWEVSNLLDPTSDDSTGDPDSDSLDNLGEFNAGTDPQDDDTDGDTMTDGWEVTYSLDPLSNDTTGDPDSDNLNNLGEFNAGTDPQDDDSDGDTMTDGWEVTYSLDPLSNDTAGDPDGDSLTNLEEFNAGSNPRSTDSDGDTMPDKWEVDNNLNPADDDTTGDPDSDNLNNLAEYQNGTDPQDSDSDNDSLPDGWEVTYNLEPNNDTGEHGATGDPDSDNLNNQSEYTKGTHPRNTDTDNDGMPDGWEDSYSLNLTGDDSGGDPDNDNLTNLEEYQKGTNPKSADTDSDGMPDGWEDTYGLDPTGDDSTGDADTDGLTNLEEYQAGTTPNDSDFDNDGMPDGWEVDNGLDPLINDATGDKDNDGVNNLGEYQRGIDPNDTDSDDDGLSDGDEVTIGSNPADPNSKGAPLWQIQLVDDSVATYGDPGPPVLKIAPNGRVAIAYSTGTPEQDLRYATLSGNTWTIQTIGTAWGTAPCVEFDSASQVHVLVGNSYRSPAGATGEVFPGSYNIGGLDMTLFSSGTPVVCGKSSNDNRMYLATEPPAPWTLEMLPGNMGYSHETDIEADSNDALHILYNSNDGFSPGAFIYRTNASGAWPTGAEPEFEFIPSTANGYVPCMEINSQDKPTIAWTSLNDPEMSMLTYTWQEGSTWYNETIAPGGRLSYALEDDDTPHIVFHGGAPSGESDKTLWYATKISGIWVVNQISEIGDDIGTITRDALDVDSGGNPHFAFIGDNGYSIYYATSLRDRDGDFMPDFWEVQYSLNPNNYADGTADTDGDGLNNLTEYQQGLNPRLADTDGDGLNDGSEVNIHPTDPLNPDTDGDGLTDGEEILGEIQVGSEGFEPGGPAPTSVSEPSVKEAISTRSGPLPGGSSGWTTGGDADWKLITDKAIEGSGSAQSGAITDNQSSWIELTRTTEAGRISFYITVSCASPGDTLEFSIDGTPMDNWSGETGWVQSSHTITAGSHTFRWTFSNDSNGTGGDNAAWLDAVQIFADSVTTDPLNADSDGDGQSDGYEVWDVGTNPNDPSSSFILEMTDVSVSGEEVTWTCVPSRLYTVWRSTDLVDWTAIATDMPSEAGDTMSYTNPENGASRAFFKITSTRAP
jgi:hypothetical protein